MHHLSIVVTASSRRHRQMDDIRSWTGMKFTNLNEHFEGRINETFYPHDAMLARVIAIVTCPSVRPSVCPSRAGIVSKRRELAS